MSLGTSYFIATAVIHNELLPLHELWLELTRLPCAQSVTTHIPVDSFGLKYVAPVVGARARAQHDRCNLSSSPVAGMW